MTQDTPAPERIASVADRAFFEQGTENVSLRDILREAEQSNMSAVKYYFGSRDGLLRAVFRRRRARMSATRNVLLDRLEVEGRAGDVRALIEVSVLPHAQYLREAPPASDYARFAARMTPRVDYSSDDVDHLEPADQRIIRSLRHALSGLPADVVDARIDTAFQMIVGAFAAYEARREEGLDYGPRTLDALSTTLVDMVTAGLTA
ncbi:TetR family transcriptional regulator [Tomitella gaofuii]|uniref:TetR family transcriptional regulator n=1 Tax=Tomitella gaofuii TaxID=2760083 RepID=UPI0015F7E05B|nr:TetR family transcriptional regulator [Tomitella gaofuii]